MSTPLQAVAAQPTAFYFYVDSSFQSYGGGIYQSSTCATYTVNHAMVLVGYFTSAASPAGAAGSYWIVKNSWGTGWGEAG